MFFRCAPVTAAGGFDPGFLRTSKTSTSAFGSAGTTDRLCAGGRDRAPWRGAAGKGIRHIVMFVRSGVGFLRSSRVGVVVVVAVAVSRASATNPASIER